MDWPCVSSSRCNSSMDVMASLTHVLPPWRFRFIQATQMSPEQLTIRLRSKYFCVFFQKNGLIGKVAAEQIFEANERWSSSEWMARPASLHISRRPSAWAVNLKHSAFGPHGGIVEISCYFKSLYMGFPDMCSSSPPSAKPGENRGESTISCGHSQPVTHAFRGLLCPQPQLCVGSTPRHFAGSVEPTGTRVCLHSNICTTWMRTQTEPGSWR